jgi:hypothetical protein
MSVSDMGASSSYSSRSALDQATSVTESKAFIGVSIAPISNESSVANLLIGSSSNSLARDRHTNAPKPEDLLLKVCKRLI